MDYDQYYAETAAAFGEKPDRILRQFVKLLDSGARVLDVGAGQGRNTVYAARQGMRVHALEPSGVGADEIERCAHAEGLDVEVFRSGFEEFVLPGSPYDAILVFGLMPDLDRSQIAELCARVREWLRPEGLLWITGFTVEDPGFSEVARTLERIGVTSFRRADGGARTYLAREEILQIFTDFAVIHHWEGLGPEHRHGDGPVERHGRFEAVLRRGEG